MKDRSHKQPSPQFFEVLTLWFKALADPNRLQLVWHLKHGERHVNGLVELTGLAQAAVSKHLKILRQAGLVEVRREGQQACYRLADPILLKICELVCDSVARRQNELAAVGKSASFLNKGANI